MADQSRIEAVVRDELRAAGLDPEGEPVDAEGGWPIAAELAHRIAEKVMEELGTPEYEYSVMYPRYSTTVPHRGPMQKYQAQAWIDEIEADGFVPGVMEIWRRPTGTWEKSPDE